MENNTKKGPKKPEKNVSAKQANLRSATGGQKKKRQREDCQNKRLGKIRKAIILKILT